MRMILIATLLAGPAAAQMAAPACDRPVVVPGLATWGKAGPGSIAVGEARRLTLQPIADARFVPPLGRPGKPGSFGGSFPLTIATGGSYRVALSTGAWIDLVRDGKALASTAHGHGPDCSGIAKIVTFRLEPGHYVVQLSEAKAAALTLMVAAGG